LKRTAELASRIKQFSLRRRADVLEKYLPTKRECLVFLKVSTLQGIIYERIKKKKLCEKDVLSFLNLMRKLFLHPVLFKNDRFQNEQLKDCLEDCRE
jgi:DNA repair and recombination protein RAD54B